MSFALAEGLDHLDEVEGLDDEARDRLDAFREELRELRGAARGSLLDLVQTILERTGVWAELEASRDRRATTARQNLATFLDRVAAFAPVQGDPSLAAFLAYLDAVEDASEPVEAVQPAPVDSVKLMTVHMAKGLEFPMVAVVGLSAGTGKDGSPRYGIFPDARVADPRRQGSLTSCGRTPATCPASPATPGRSAASWRNAPSRTSGGCSMSPSPGPSSCSCSPRPGGTRDRRRRPRARGRSGAKPPTIRRWMSWSGPSSRPPAHSPSGSGTA